MGNMAFDFLGRTVVVTGAARGIGKALAAFFRDAGATVYVVDFDAAAAHEAAEDLKVSVAVADVSDSADADRVIAQVIEATGRVDVLINNAGVLRDGVLWKLTDADWDLVQSVHLGGPFRLTRACVPHFRTQGYGRVINVSSYTGLHGNIGQANYAAAKAGIVGFTKTAAKELARFGVTVNAIVPNAETRMVASIPEDKRSALTAMVPMDRFGSPEEMCAAVGFLASQEAAYVTGALLAVDGGLSM